MHAPLISLTLPDSVTTIGDDAFSSAQLTSLTLPDSVTTIGDYAFDNAKLSFLRLPNNDLTIHTSTFRSSEKYLNLVYIPSETTIIVNQMHFEEPTQLFDVCTVAVYEPRNDWTDVPERCIRQINFNASSACNNFVGCPDGTLVRYDVGQCQGEGECTQADCCGIFIEPTQTFVYSEAEITQMKNTISGLMTNNNGNCVLN